MTLYLKYSVIYVKVYLVKGGFTIKYKINAVYFSATGTTKKAAEKLAYELAKHFNEKTIFCKDFTLPSGRIESLRFSDKDIVIAAVPVYAGRVPNVLLKYLNSMQGYGAKAVPLVLYGNRDYDDALVELTDILRTGGFKICAAGAFIGEHSFSKVLAEGRPDKRDLEKLSVFAKQIYTKLSCGIESEPLVPGNKKYRDYYKPKDKNGNPVDIRKVTPKTGIGCTDCKLCVSVCPMGSIDYNDVSKLNNICIKCGACIKACPVNAKYYDDENYLHHKYELEINFAERKEPVVFL
jgi:ferredoxin